MKPIAEIVWAGGIEDSIKDVRFYKVPSPDVGTKLYTHPVKELPNNHQYIAQLEMTVRNQQAEIEALKEELKKSAEVNRLLAEDIGYEQ